MARNPFEQLQDVVAEPRQAFEDITTKILKSLNPDQRRIRVFRGDGGIDTFTGSLASTGKADVYQVKYFPGVWGNSQKQQIREAYQRARESKDYQLGTWTLCVPVRLTKEDLRWFDEWRTKQDRPIELMDGDDLTGHLSDDRCGKVREELTKLGVIGLQSGGPRFKATAFIYRQNYERTGLTASVVLRVENDGDKTARGIKVTIKHSETGCVAEHQRPDWEQSPDDSRLNPRVLHYKRILNPGDHSLIMGIPLCDRTAFPFGISIRLTANDSPVSELHCNLTADQIAVAEPVTFEDGAVAKTAMASTTEKINPPISPAAKEVLELILSHSVKEERGFTEILSSDLPGPLEILCIPNATQAGGGAFTMKKSLTRAALKELVQLGWLLPPEEDGTYRVYELNPAAPESQ